MNALPDELDWSSAEANPLRATVTWRKKVLGPGYKAQVDGARWELRMGDFPDEPMWTLLIDGREIARFTDWPPEWRKA